MKGIQIFVCIFLGFSATVFPQEKEPPDFSDVFRLMDGWLEAQIAFDKLPGMSVAIVKDQDIIYNKAFGKANPEDATPAQTNTVYSICSISKLFTSVAIMKLWDEGKLRLDDRIEDVLPWYNLEQQYPGSGPVTIRSLLTHSSGLPRESDYSYWTGPDFPFPSDDQIRQKLSSQQTLYPADTFFQYSNLGMTLLGAVIKEVSGQEYDHFIYENIIHPLQLKDTRTELPENLYGSKLAVGYGSIKRDGTRNRVQFFQAEGIRAAAGFSSTVEDLARFASWQFRLVENGGQEILKASTLRNMQRVHYTDPDWETTWGLGFSIQQVNGSTIIGHGGSCPGYRSVLLLDMQKKVAVVVMINASGTSPGQYGQELMALLEKAESGVIPDKAIDGHFENYAGIYNQQPWWSEALITPWYGKLVFLDLPSENPSKSLTFFKHIESHIFKRIREDDTLGEEMVFECDQAGKAIRYQHHSNYYYKIQ